MAEEFEQINMHFIWKNCKRISYLKPISKSHSYVGKWAFWRWDVSEKEWDQVLFGINMNNSCCSYSIPPHTPGKGGI